MKSIDDAIQFARATIIIDLPFFGSLLVALRTVENKFIPTFRMDGEIIEYNPDHAATLSKKQMRTVICECILHGALQHVFRMEGREPHRYNKACDYAVANVMRDSNAHAQANGDAQLRDYFDLTDLDKWCPPDKAFDNLSVEEIYAKLPPSPPLPPGPLPGSSPGSSQGPGNPGPNTQKQEGNAPPAMSPGEIKEAEGSKEEIEEQKADWQVKVVQAANAASQAGKMPQLLQRLVDEVVDPRVPWREQLRQFFNVRQRDDFSWKRPKSGLVHLGLYLPSLDSLRMGPVVVGIDTSGSINDVILQAFQSELQAIIDECAPSRLVVIYCDAQVNKVKEYEAGDIIELKAIGGGGTDFRPVFDYVATTDISPCCLVYLTDTFGAFPHEEPEYPVLWGSITKNGIVPFGEMIYIDVN
jgi:predicted metal-dependent peptidase